MNATSIDYDGLRIAATTAAEAALHAYHHATSLADQRTTRARYHDLVAGAARLGGLRAQLAVLSDRWMTWKTRAASSKARLDALKAEQQALEQQAERLESTPRSPEAAECWRRSRVIETQIAEAAAHAQMDAQEVQDAKARLDDVQAQVTSAVAALQALVDVAA